MEFFITLFKFILSTVTDLALIPSILAMAEYKRHFELFIGISQVKIIIIL